MHEVGIIGPAITCPSVDGVNPRCAEIAMFNPSIARCMAHCPLNCIAGDSTAVFTPCVKTFRCDQNSGEGNICHCGRKVWGGEELAGVWRIWEGF